MIVEPFAGPGGWDEGLAWLGRRDIIGLEWDHAACMTAVAAGHMRIRCDVAQYPTAPFAGADGVIASPPCQAWSMAGKRKGELDRSACHVLADRMADGDDSLDWTGWEDPRSPLVCQPVRWVRDIRPAWVALEEVPAVASLWEHFARIFRTWGYSVWTGDLCAADYGVPQTRTRRILLAHRDRIVQPPVPMHAEHPGPPDLFGDTRLPWVSMATALGWDDGLTVNTRGERRTAGGNEFSADDPSWGLTSSSRSWVVRPEFIRLGTQDGATVRHIDDPAPTLFFGHQSNDVRWHAEQPPTRAEREAAKQSWAFERPATTVVGSFSPDVIAAPGYRLTESRQNAEGGVLQSFPADYPWQGSRTKQYEQVGNAIPPLLAAHCLAALGVAESLGAAA